MGSFDISLFVSLTSSTSHILFFDRNEYMHAQFNNILAILHRKAYVAHASPVD